MVIQYSSFNSDELSLDSVAQEKSGFDHDLCSSFDGKLKSERNIKYSLQKRDMFG